MESLPVTKKMLVAYDPAKPDKVSSDFLVPVSDRGRVVLFGSRSKRNIELGLVVFVGREISTHDILARLTESGREIPSVAAASELIFRYVGLISALKIGQVVRILDEAEAKCFLLQQVELAKLLRRRALP